ncbi:hypothetical protein CPB86DRAFT_782283 [Serendipita vermifera]|nr:hypothetical protein CPB86DRAFT_782283 [Serendipita vermifera]
MPREVKQRVNSSDEEDEVQRHVAADANSESGKEEGKDAQKEEDDNEQDEEEYEIERIIHHNSTYFGSKLGYYVKWKGYPSTDNSWVREEDCNAPDLIAKYWEGKNRKGKQNKGRPVKRDREEEDVDMKDDFAEEPPKKKNKKESLKAKSTSSASDVANGRTKFRSVDQNADDEYKIEEMEDHQEKYSSMEQAYPHDDDWTPFIERILTVDLSSDDPSVVIYFLRLKDASFKAATTQSMAKKAPGLVIKFFEQNLKFSEKLLQV